jgi:hypothetical protein
MSEASQGFLTGTIIILMGLAFWSCIIEKTEICMWCVSASLILAEVIF